MGQKQASCESCEDDVVVLPGHSLTDARVRLVCVSDTHNLHRSLYVPDGDVLIHSGDATDFGTLDEMRDFFDWLMSLPHRRKIFVPGNHDIGLDTEGYPAINAMWKVFRSVSEPSAVAEVVPAQSESFVMLLGPSPQKSGTAALGLGDEPSSTCIEVCGYRLFGCARTRHIATAGTMAFDLLNDAEAESVWSAIPDDTEVLVTHGPPYGRCDCFYGLHLGCPVLRRHLERVRPLVHIFGHVHPGHGVEELTHSDYPSHARQNSTLCLNAAISKATKYDPRRPTVLDLPLRLELPVASRSAMLQ